MWHSYLNLFNYTKFRLPAIKPEKNPTIWALASQRAGENTQITALAKGLGNHFNWPIAIRRLAYWPWSSVPGFFRRKSLVGVNQEKSDPLKPPWPRILIASNLDNEPVVRQIKAASDGYTKLVAIGRTWADYEHFDLIVTTPQYRLPESPNILHNLTTLSLYDPSESKPVALFSDGNGLPSPYLAVCLGGRSGPFAFGRKAALRLAGMANELALSLGASVLSVTSARTDPSSVEAFQAGLKVPHKLYRYSANQKDNPYPEIIKVAASFVVTGDSIAMLSEAVATGRPVYIFDLGAGRRSMHQPAAAGRPDRTLATEAYHLLMQFGPKRAARDITLVHKLLVDQGHAIWLGEGVMREASLPPQPLARAIASIAKIV